MNKNSLVKKELVVAVILLFLGMSVISSAGTVVEKNSTMPTSYHYGQINRLRERFWKS